jgi:hypothetical protein
MKKFFSCILLTLLLALTSTIVFAEDSKQYPISRYGLTIQFSSEWVVATKDAVPDIEAYNGNNGTRDYIVNLLNEEKIELYALYLPNTKKFVSISRIKGMENSSASGKENFETLCRTLPSNAKIKSFERYDASNHSFTFTQIESFLRAGTYSNEIGLIFDYSVNGSPVDENQRSDFKGILNTVTFPTKVSTSSIASSSKEVKPAVTSKVTAKGESSSAVPSSSQAESKKDEQSSSTITSSNSTISAPIAPQAKEATKVSSIILTILISVVSTLLIVGIVFAIIIIRKRKNK